METALAQAAFPRTDVRTLADDGDALHFCSTCAFSRACLDEGMDKRALMDLHVLVEHVGPFHAGEHVFREGDSFDAIAAVRAGDDRMQFDLKTVTVSAACPTITIELAHTGNLAAQVMGHNVVISKTADVGAVSAAGMKAGGAGGYVPKGAARVIAATPVIGGGASTRAKFPGSKLKAGGDYTFYCSFPGHSAIMKGALVVTR